MQNFTQSETFPYIIQNCNVVLLKPHGLQRDHMENNVREDGGQLYNTFCIRSHLTTSDNCCRQYLGFLLRDPACVLCTNQPLGRGGAVRGLGAEPGGPPDPTLRHQSPGVNTVQQTICRGAFGRLPPMSHLR